MGQLMTRRATALAAGLWLAASAGAAQAQAPRLWWVCGVEVPLSRDIGMRMTIVGPTLRHVVVNNLYLTAFETADPAGRDRAAAYEADFVSFVGKSGYSTVSSVADDTTASSCLPHGSPQEAEATKARLTADRISGGGGVKLTTNNVFLTWSPVPAAAVSAGPSPVAGPRSGAPAAGGLGASFQDVTPQTAQLLGLDPAQGAAVMAVEPGGAAARGGLRRMDVVTEISGQAVATAADLTQIVARLRPGFRAPVRVWRDGATRDLTLEIAAAPAAGKPDPAKSAASGPARAAAVAGGPGFGLCYATSKYNSLTLVLTPVFQVDAAEPAETQVEAFKRTVAASLRADPQLMIHVCRADLTLAAAQDVRAELRASHSIISTLNWAPPGARSVGPF